MEEKTKYGGGYTCTICGKYNRTSTLCHHNMNELSIKFYVKKDKTIEEKLSEKYNITSKEKAENLVDMFMNIEPNKLSDYSRIYHPTAKQCAILLVNEVLESHKRDYELNESKTYWHPYDYWQNVKEEIQKL